MNFLSPKKKKHQPEASTACSHRRRIVAAACNGWTSSLHELARLGANMNARLNDSGSGSGVTALHIAAVTGNNEVVKILIRHGADVNCRESNYQSTPLHFAAMKGNGSDVAALSAQSVIQLNREIAERGCSSIGEISLSDEARHSAENYEAVIVTLVRKGADPNAKDAHGMTALHLAVNHRSDAVKTLLALGADVDAQDNAGRLPWHYAIDRDNCDGLRWLLAFGADINDLGTSVAGDMSRRALAGNAKHLMLDQLTRLRAADLFVASQYRGYANGGESYSRSYSERCANEVAKMKAYEIEDGVCLYDLLHMSPRRRAAYVRADDRTERMLIEFEREFPNYYGIVRACFHDEKKRRPLIKHAKAAWYHLTNIGLPDICVEHILGYLDGCCLKIMVEGAKRCKALD